MSKNKAGNGGLVSRTSIEQTVSRELTGSSGNNMTVAVYDDGSSWYEKPLENLSKKEASASLISGILFGNTQYMGSNVRVRNDKLQSGSVGNNLTRPDRNTLEKAPNESLESLYLAGAGKAIMGDGDVLKNIQYDSEEERFHAFDYDEGGQDFRDVLPSISSHVEDIACQTTELDENEVEYEILDLAAETAAYTDFSRIEEEMDQYNFDQSVEENILGNLKELQEYHMDDEDPYEFLNKSSTPDEGVELL